MLQRVATRECRNCATPFVIEPGERKRLFCSDDCRDARKADVLSVHRKAQRKPLLFKSCAICSADFATRREIENTCSDSCLKEWKSAYQAFRNATIKATVTPLQCCVVCGVEEHSNAVRTFVCSSPDCKTEQKRRRDAAWRDNNREHLSAYAKTYIRNTSEEQKARNKEANKAWRVNNRETLLKMKKRYRESDKGKAAIAAWLARTVEHRREWAKQYWKTYRPPNSPLRLKRRKLLAIARNEPFKSWRERKRAESRRVRNAIHYQHLKAAGHNAVWAMRERIYYHANPKRKERVLQRRREGAAAYNLLCDMGLMIPVQGQDAIRRAHTEALHVFRAEPELKQLLEDATQ